jgi:lipoprotein-anchoring transpeptidase ErfK/SrfK
VLPVVGRRAGWLAVITPELANGRVGWIRARGVTFLRNAYTVRISLHRREAVVLRGARAVQRFTVGIGGPGSPTPVGRYAVTDRLYMRGTRAYGCCVLALSGHQPRTPPEWTGGDRLAIHGTDEPSTVGRAASLGCLRARRADALRLVRTVPLGTPVLIAA